MLQYHFFDFNRFNTHEHGAADDDIVAVTLFRSLLFHKLHNTTKCLNAVAFYRSK